MKRALVLSSGAAWGAFQIGALEYLVSDRLYHFDICAGTGIGAMNAAFVACGEFAALRSFWERIGWLKLVSPNWRHPIREAPFTARPQRKFIREHVRLEKLEKANRKLVISSMNLDSGEQVYFTYPGSDTPLVEALIGAVSMPGLTPPLDHPKGTLAEGTFVNSFILDHIITHFEAQEYYGVAVLPTGRESNIKKRRYRHWRQAMRRTIQINLSRDIHKAFDRGRAKVQAIRAYRQMIERLESRVGEEITEDRDREALQKYLERFYEDSDGIYNRQSEPALYEIVSENEVESPLWSFRGKQIRELIKRGYTTANKTIS